MKLKFSILVVTIIVVLIAVLLIRGRKIDVHTNRSVAGLSEELQDILYLGSLAPNSHNIQSWIIDVYPNQEMIKIKIDPDRTLNVIDPVLRENYISLGCYTMTLMNSFKAYGYETTQSYNDELKEISLNYHKTSETTDQDLIDLILKRHTDKRAFEPTELTSDSFNDVYPVSDSVQYYSSDTTEFAAIKNATLNAYIAQAGDSRAAQELSKWLRLSNSETISTKDGLPAEQLGISGFRKSIYYLITTHESATGESFAKQGITTAENQLDNCSGFVIITSENSEEELIACGIQTVNLWLSLTDAGISVQPMSYAIEEPVYKSNLEKALNIENIQMILRIGYTNDYGTNAAIRRDLTDYISVN